MKEILGGLLGGGNGGGNAGRNGGGTTMNCGPGNACGGGNVNIQGPVNNGHLDGNQNYNGQNGGQTNIGGQNSSHGLDVNALLQSLMGAFAQGNKSFNGQMNIINKQTGQSATCEDLKSFLQQQINTHQSPYGNIQEISLSLIWYIIYIYFILYKLYTVYITLTVDFLENSSTYSSQAYTNLDT